MAKLILTESNTHKYLTQLHSYFNKQIPGTTMDHVKEFEDHQWSSGGDKKLSAHTQKLVAHVSKIGDENLHNKAKISDKTFEDYAKSIGQA